MHVDSSSTILVSPRHRALIVPWHNGAAQLIGHAKPLVTPQGTFLAVPHRTEETRLLRNLGFANAPAPILSYYDWASGQPFAIQRRTAAMLSMNQRAFVLNEFGTGKTRAALFAIDWLIQSGEAERALVIAPLSTLTATWEREIFRFFPRLTASVLYGDRARRLKRLAEPADVYIINHDGVHTVRDALAARPDINVVVIDELATYRNGTTQRWKSLNHILSGRRFVWGMTGSPTPNAPTDAWAQVKLLSPGRVPRYFKQFKNEAMTQVSQFRWVPKPGANNLVYEAMQPSVRFRRDDAMELPPVSFLCRTVPLEGKNREVYKLMEKRLQVEVENHRITAANEGVMINKLLQIACGFVYTATRGVVQLDTKHRFDVIEEILVELDRKLIIFAPYVHAVKAVHDFVVKLGFDAALVYGDTPRAERDAAFINFQHADTPRILVAHPGTMAHGLTLTAANTILWYCLPQSLEIYEQANARITRPGQTAKQAIIHLIGSPIEQLIYARLRRQQTMQGLLLAMFQGVNEAPVNFAV